MIPIKLIKIFTKKIPLLFLWIVLCNTLPAQNDWYHYNWAAQKKVNSENVYNYAYNYGLKKYHENIFIGQHHKEFSLLSAAYLYNVFNSGWVYRDLTKQEAYVRAVLKTIVKDTAVCNDIKIIFSRDVDFNASMDGIGYLTLNIGLLSDLDSEAELAFLLGHEVAHYLNQDAVRNYGRRMEARYSGGSNSPWGWISLYNNYKGYYWHSREQESMADEVAEELIKNSPYSLSTASVLFRKFKRREIRNEIKYGKRSHTFSTHPDPGNRISRVKQLMTDEVENKKRKFVVDSVAFFHLKDHCHKEVINMCLMNNYLEDLLLNCFSRYLLEPEDQNNLAALTEGLRRLLLFEKRKNLHDRSFILGYYQKEVIQESKNYAFLNEKNPSILNHLKKGFVDIWKEDFDKIKALDLKDTTVTEFTTDEEAYLYFLEKSKSSNNIVTSHYNYFGPQASFEKVDAFVKANSLFATNDLLLEKGKVPSRSGELIVIIPPDPMNVLSVMDHFDLSEYKRSNNLLLQSVTGKSGDKVIQWSDLNTIEAHHLASLYGHCSFYLQLTAGPIVTKQKINWLETSPELYSFFKSNNIGTVYIYSSTLRNPNELVADFYRISVPDGNAPTFCGQRLLTKVTSQNETVFDIDKISKQIQTFRGYFPK